EQLRGSQRHKQEVDLDALTRRTRAQQGEEEPAGAELGPVQKKKGKHAAVIKDDTDYGEDPYAEPQ
ncbi:MAG: hypothetical protein Q7J64_04515, partial [Elusimicrobiota bacterium]|nr:hypothetical protein [Elusimicrobiota bacterium]